MSGLGPPLRESCDSVICRNDEQYDGPADRDRLKKAEGGRISTLNCGRANTTDQNRAEASGEAS
jgi:hypothetical protein